LAAINGDHAAMCCYRGQGRSYGVTGQIHEITGLGIFTSPPPIGKYKSMKAESNGHYQTLNI
jgi:hypothetical protein